MRVLTTTMAVGDLLGHLRFEIGEGLGQRHTGETATTPFCPDSLHSFISLISFPWRVEG